jgi:hypothetical protein
VKISFKFGPPTTPHEKLCTDAERHHTVSLFLLKADLNKPLFLLSRKIYVMMLSAR